MRTFLGIPGAFRARHPRNEGQEGGESGTIPRESTWVCSKRGRGRGRVREREGRHLIECEMGEGEFRPFWVFRARSGPGIREARENRTLRADRFGCKYKC